MRIKLALLKYQQLEKRCQMFRRVIYSDSIQNYFLGFDTRVNVMQNKDKNSKKTDQKLKISYGNLNFTVTLSLQWKRKRVIMPSFSRIL